MDNYNYGIIGNCTSAALISDKGSLDWCCLPDFSSRSFFANILDESKGGEFSIHGTDDYEIQQNYINKTNILVTIFKKGNDAFEIVDFMPRYKKNGNSYICPPEIIRFVRHLSGTSKIIFNYNPKPNYARNPVKTEISREYIKTYTVKGNYESIYLYTNFNKQDIAEANEITIDKDYYFLISYNQKLLKITMDKIYLEYNRTKVYWLEWADRSIYFKKYNDVILRSALILKLLSYQKTGAIIAAATTSLPETIGEVRNWDYRYCWIRDSSMVITVLTNLGHYNVAERFLSFILDIIPYKNEKMQIMYGINREKILTEVELPWLSGYKNSKPVRIGNKAYIQKQNDIYGVLLDVIYKYFTIFTSRLERSEELWTITRSLVRTVILNWRRPDMGIWEFRSRKRSFVFSKVLCWVALDRGVKIAGFLKKNNYVELWAKERNKIKKDILTKGWNENVGAFTQAYDNTAMDAANLLMATYGFIDYKDEKYIKTVNKIYETLNKNGIMYRYLNEDDFGRPHTSFTICSFWLVKSLYKIGRKKEAKDMFEKLLEYSNHLGLFSEGIDFTTKRLLGNFPQGYSHLALIDAAIVLIEKQVEEKDKLISKLEHGV
jgi:alpha,alpha-trehalase